MVCMVFAGVREMRIGGQGRRGKLPIILLKRERNLPRLLLHSLGYMEVKDLPL